MSLPHTRPTLSRSAAGAVALLAAAMLTLAGTPARAEPAASADLEFHVAGEKVVNTASKPFWLHLRNVGPGAADNVVVTIDVSGLDTAKLRIEVRPEPDCVTTGPRTTCRLGGLGAGQTAVPWSPLTVTSVDGTGSAGSFTLAVSSATPDPEAANNQPVTVAVEVADAGHDLQANAFDTYAEPGSNTPISPQQSADLTFGLNNVGTVDATGVVFTVSLPSYVTFDGVRPECRYNAANTVATCVSPVIVRPGQRFGLADPLRVKVAADAPGPIALLGGIVSGRAATAGEVPSAAPATRAANNGAVVRPIEKLPAAGDADPSDNHAEFAVFTAANPANLAVTAGSGSGAVGATVDINVTAENRGPASSPSTRLRITAPTGTELVRVPAGCTMEPSGTVATCTGLLAAGARDTATFVFKIMSGTVADGKAEISGVLEDPDLTNNTAPIRITVTGSGGGLPITGDNTVLLVAAGLAALLAGAVLYSSTRRRRVLLLTPDTDA